MGIRLKSWIFSTQLRWQSDASGTLRAPGAPALDFGSPPEFGGPEGRWTPEQMLVGAAEACTMLTFLAQARREGLQVLGYTSLARGTLSTDVEGSTRFTGIAIEPRIEVCSENDAQKARAILAQLQDRCFIGASLKSEPRIEPVILAVGR